MVQNPDTFFHLLITWRLIRTHKLEVNSHPCLHLFQPTAAAFIRIPATPPFVNYWVFPGSHFLKIIKILNNEEWPPACMKIQYTDGWDSVCTKGSHSLNHAEVNHALLLFIDLIALVTDNMLDIGGEWNSQQSLGRCFLYFVLFVQEQLPHA